MICQDDIPACLYTHPPAPMDELQAREACMAFLDDQGVC